MNPDASIVRAIANDGGMDRPGDPRSGESTARSRDRTASFLVSCLLSATAAHFINFSVILYAQEVFGSNLLAGVGFALCFGTPVVFGWYAGVICDRRSPIKIVHAAHLAFIAAVTGLGMADRWIHDLDWRTSMMMACAFLVGIGWSFVAPGRMTALASVTTPDKLQKVSMVYNLMPIIGFGLAPALLAAVQSAFGWQGTLVLPFVLFVASSALLYGIYTPSNHEQAKPLLEDILAGIHTVTRSPLLRQTMMGAIIILMVVGPLQVLVLKMARTQFGFSEMGSGSFMMILAPSIVVGGVLCMIVAKHWSHGKVLTFAIIIVGMLLAAMSGAHDRSSAIGLLFMIGVASGFGSSIVSSTIQTQAPTAFRGRVMSIYGITTQVMPALSGLVAGILSHSLGEPAAMMICGIAIAAFGLLNVPWTRELRAFRGS
ncbi:MFS transporter [Ramlibacter sp. AN1015]|uniref:MFS transporter n=1 Tax=Ramlibacter sp. AN1015 TaxID=3133428 RepID=UPI0030BDF733